MARANVANQEYTELTNSAYSSFTFENSLLGVKVVEGHPWFIVRDVMDALEYPESSSLDEEIVSVPEEWKGCHQVPTPGGYDFVPTLSESGLYFFLGSSKKPKLPLFQKWFLEDVLPTIRALSIRGQNQRIKQAQAMAALVSEEVSREIFDHVLNDTGELLLKNYIVWLSHDGKPRVDAMPHNARIVTMENLEMILRRGLVNTDELRSITEASIKELNRRMEWLMECKNKPDTRPS